MTMNGGLHLRVHTSRLYIRSDQSTLGLKNYASKSTETLPSADRVTEECEVENTDDFKKRRQQEP